MPQLDQDPIPALVGLGGSAIVAGLAYYVGQACPRLPKGAMGLGCIVIGVAFNVLASYDTGVGLARAVVLGIESGLAAVGLLHGFAVRARSNGNGGEPECKSRTGSGNSTS